MLGRMREGWIGGLGRRLAAIGSGFVDTFLRDNRVIPLVLALLALLVFAWVVAGLFLGDPDGEQVSSEANFAQSEDQPGTDPPAPEIENRNADSYAAYQSKDPFRQLLSPEGETTTTTTTDPGTTTQETTDDGATAGPGDEDGGGGGSDSLDTDADGVSDQRESELGLDPLNPDTDGDGTLDGDEDSGGGPRGGARDGGGGGRQGRDDGLFDSGGELRLP